VARLRPLPQPRPVELIASGRCPMLRSRC
jgi:hypothetical protein